MKRKLFFTLILSLILLITACSSSSNDSDKKSKSDYGSNEFAGESSSDNADYDSYEEEYHNEAEAEVEADVDTGRTGSITTNRMIIHQAQLSIKVKDLEETQLKIEKKVTEYGGYIVEANIYKQDEESLRGNITVRIPEKHFQTFLKDTEEEAADVLERNVTGQDVTEQYVDLESRLKSKRVVEERLLDFMGDAKKTEDLLKISTDLSQIQEEIEVIVGRMKYLENQTSYSTIEIAMYENRVIIPHLESKNLDTWEKTKKQLATSVNFILAAGSGLIVFLVGNLPIIFIVLLIGSAVYFAIRRRKTE